MFVNCNRRKSKVDDIIYVSLHRYSLKSQFKQRRESN